MRLIGYLLMTLALCAGTLSATTAYVPVLDPAGVEGLTLNAEAGLATAENEGVLDHAALAPPYAIKALESLRDSKRGKPRVEVRFALGADTTTSLEHPGDVGLVVFADDAGMDALGLDEPGPAMVTLGLSPAQIRAITEPKPTKDGERMMAVPPGDAVALQEGVIVPLPTMTGLTPLASLSETDRYALVATYAIDADLRRATLEERFPEVAAERAQVLEDLQAVLDANAPDGAVPDADAEEEPADHGASDAGEQEPDPALHLNDDGRLVTGADAQSKSHLAIGQARDVLTPGLINALDASGTERVRVKEFAFGRWQLSWLLGVSVVAMLVGVFIVRNETKKMIAKSVADAQGSTETPEVAMRRTGECLDRAMATTNVHDALVPLTEIQRDHFPVIVDSRNLLVGRMGLAGFAAFMDEFSFLERQVNRAWSAAADDAYAESRTALERAHAMVERVQNHLDESA